MTDPLIENLTEKRKELAAEQAKYEAQINELAESSRRREERNTELLEQISKQLESIEQLLRERLVQKHE